MDNLSLIDSPELASACRPGASIDLLELQVPKGHVSIKLLDAEGKVIDSYESKNAIVNAGRSAIMQLFSGDTSTTPPTVQYMGIGINGAPATNAFAPFTSAPSDVNLTDSAQVTTYRNNGTGTAFIEINVADTTNSTYVRGAVNNTGNGSRTYISSPAGVTYTATFSSANVKNIVSEAALFSKSAKNVANDTMLARFCFPSMYLKADVTSTLQIAWTISF